MPVLSIDGLTLNSKRCISLLIFYLNALKKTACSLQMVFLDVWLPAAAGQKAWQLNVFSVPLVRSMTVYS